MVNRTYSLTKSIGALWRIGQIQAFSSVFVATLRGIYLGTTISSLCLFMGFLLQPSFRSLEILPDYHSGGQLVIGSVSDIAGPCFDLIPRQVMLRTSKWAINNLLVWHSALENSSKICWLARWHYTVTESVVRIVLFLMSPVWRDAQITRWSK